MKFLVLIVALYGVNAQNKAASCTTDVTGFYLPSSGPSDHYVVPVGTTFEATFSFQSDSSSWVVTKGYQHFAPGTTEDPGIGNNLRQEDYQFTASYACEFSIGHTPKGAPSSYEAQYLKFEYGTAFPDSATCDTLFECCDIGCEIEIDPNSDVTDSLPQNPHIAEPDGMYGVVMGDWGGSACDDGVDACVGCNGMFEAVVKIHADCPDAEVTLEAVETSGVEVNIPNRTFRDWDRVPISHQCPSKRGSTHYLKFQVTDQYEGTDYCELEFECSWCPNTQTCPMCAPDQKEYICYNDRNGDFNLVAITEEDLAALDPKVWIYPTEYYPGFDDDLGVQFDCWCDPICETPPAGLTFICHNDEGRDEWQLAAVHSEDRSGPMNDLNDYLAAGDGFPGTHIDGDFYDCWCNVIA